MSDLGITIKRGTYNESNNPPDFDNDSNVGDVNYNNYYQFALKSSNIAISHNRTPIVSSLPGADPILLDLGQWTVDLKIEGTADIPIYISSSTLEKYRESMFGSIPIADKDDLEFIVSPTFGIKPQITLTPQIDYTWYKKDILIEDATKFEYTNNKPKQYIIKIAGLSLSKDNVNNYYNFVLTGSGFLIN